MKISELLIDIQNKNLVLPEFQREFVWHREQSKKLMGSLLKEYPVGGLLFWKTKQPPALKNLDDLPETLGAIQVILDGQQRLTTLYMLINGEIPPYYREAEIINDPRDLFYNIEEGEFEYYQPIKMKNNPLWHRVVDCFNKKIEIFEIAETMTENKDQAFQKAEQFSGNLNRLQNIREKTLHIQVVPEHASLDEAIDVFDRVNSQDTKLTDAELALTHVPGKWPTARRQMKEKIADLHNRYFYFDLTFMTRALTGTVAHRALFETIHETPRVELEQGWKGLQKILDYLVNVLPEHAFIHSTKDLNTTNVFIPLLVYLSLHETKFPNEKTRNHAIHWLYAAHT